MQNLSTGQLFLSQDFQVFCSANAHAMTCSKNSFCNEFLFLIKFVALPGNFLNISEHLEILVSALIRWKSEALSVNTSALTMFGALLI